MINMKKNKNKNKNKKLSAWLLTGVVSVSLIGVSLTTGCGRLTQALAGAVLEEAQRESDAEVEIASEIESVGESGSGESASSAESGNGESAVLRLERIMRDETESGAGEETDAGVATAEAAGFDEDSIQFTTVDLNGTPVTGDLFGDADLTLVFVWATYCGPCISSIPDYEELYENLPENVNLIGIVSDVYEGDAWGTQEANDIMDENGAKFQSILLSDSVQPLLSGMQFTPSAFFVDRQGHMVGDFMDGGGFSDAVERLSELLG